MPPLACVFNKYLPHQENVPSHCSVLVVSDDEHNTELDG